MVNYTLFIGADLHELTHLQPQGGCNDKNFIYQLQLKCENCGRAPSRLVWVFLSRTIQAAERTVHHYQRCICHKEGTITMIPDQGKPLEHMESEIRQYAPLMKFDCRGVEPVDYKFGPGWKVRSLYQTEFEDVDLSDREFYAFDEEGQCDVSITDLRFKFEASE